MDFDDVDWRAVDAAVAKHVLGYEVAARRNARTGELDFVCRRPGQPWQRVSFFSCAGDVIALAVEFKLSDLGWKLTPASEARRRAPEPVRVVLERDGAQVEATAWLFESALCVAALRAVGQGAEVLRQEAEAWRAGQQWAAQRYRSWYSRFFSRHN